MIPRNAFPQELGPLNLSHTNANFQSLGLLSVVVSAVAVEVVPADVEILTGSTERLLVPEL